MTNYVVSLKVSRRDAHPMAIMVGVMGALSAFYHNNLDVSKQDHREITAIRFDC